MTAYRPDIDGLRAVAVLPVVLFHAGVAALGGGYVGVDVFFVISGYLITSMIVADIRGDKFSISRFYERRIRRIWPALFAMLAVASIAGWWLLPPADLADFGRSALATSAFGSNILFWIQSGYFDAPAHLKPLLHTWSLAVEEQYYIVFPLVLFAMRRRSARAQQVILAALFAASLAACVWMTARDPSTTFYLSPFRGWELLTGSLLAVGAVPALRTRAVREVAALAGLALIAWSIVAFDESTRFPGAYALAPCVGTALIIHAGAESLSIVGRVLASPPFVFVGKISYSLYLWHWPLLIFAGFYLVAPMTAAQTAIVVALAIVTAILSWRFVEQPVRQSKSLTRRHVFVYAAAATAVIIAFAGATQVTHGFPSRVSALARRYDDARTHRSPDRERCHGTDARPIPFADKCTYGAPGKPPTVAIWGDSFAAEIGYELGALARDHGETLLYISYSACGPAVGVFDDAPACERHNEDVLAQLVAAKTITRVVLAANFPAYARRNGGRFGEGYARVATALADAGKQVVVVYPIPTPPGHVPSILARLEKLGRDVHEADISRADYDAANHDTIAALDQLVKHANIRAAHPEHALCSGDRCAVVAGDDALYFDVDHLSLEGAKRVLPELGLF